MAKILSFNQFITEAAKWDNPHKKYIDKFFVSFDDKEKYEVRDLLHAVTKKLSHEVDKDELMNIIMKCKNKVPQNHPRKRLLACVLGNFGIDVQD